MATRGTSRSEDQAYCLFGLFSLNMPLLYGEGYKAFQRLLFEILNRTGDESVFIQEGRDAFDAETGMIYLPRHRFKGANQVLRADTHNRSPMVVSARWAELYMSGSRGGVFHRNRDPNYLLVRLNCINCQEQTTSSPCVMILQRMACGHLVQTSVFERRMYTNRSRYPLCEQDLVDPDQWVSLNSDSTELLHVSMTDALSCRSKPRAQYRNNDVSFQTFAGS